MTPWHQSDRTPIIDDVALSKSFARTRSHGRSAQAATLVLGCECGIYQRIDRAAAPLRIVGGEKLLHLCARLVAWQERRG